MGTKTGLEEALAECLTSLERGGSIEECLARYPRLARELESLLLTATGLQQAYDVGPRPSFQRAALQRFLAAASRRRRPLAVVPPPRRFSFGWRWVPAAVGAPVLVGAIALAMVLGLSSDRDGAEGRITVRHIAPAPSATETVPTPEPGEIDQLVARLEAELGQMQEQVAQGAVIQPETIVKLKDINQSLQQTLPAAPPESVGAQPEIAGLLEQQQTLLHEATKQNQVAPEAADDVDEVIRIAGEITDKLLPTVTPTPTPTATPAPSETPASSATATATPEASGTATATPVSSPGPGPAGGETIVPLTPAPSP
jgi:hypothetical protein